jgi:drug/metabolite transporter (DMT)-like permease
MIYIVLAILTSIFLLSVFKLFEKYKVNTFHAIITNYITAALTGFLFSQHKIDFNLISETSWLYVCLPLGFLFISVFYLISLTAQKISIAAASVANKMSVVIPVLFSIIFIGESFNTMKIIGIILALIAVYFTNKRNTAEHHTSKTLLWLPVLVFIGSGLIDTGINAAKTYLFTLPVHSDLFSIGVFASAFIIGICVLAFQFLKQPKGSIKFELKSLIGGIVLGIPNYFSIFFILKSLEANIFTSAQLFPVLNISNVVLTALVGFLVFKEKLSTKNLLGVLLAVISILLITY